MAERSLQTPEGKRLEEARVARGFKDAKAAAAYFNWNYDTYIQHERGERGITRAAGKYAKAFRVSKAWLLTGEGGGPGVLAPIVGVVGAGGALLYNEAIGGEPDTIQAPAGSPPETVAVEIQGDSAGAFFNGWLALYARRFDPVVKEIVGSVCVVGTADGRVLLKKLLRGKAGTFTLESGDGSREENVRLAWGAKVIDIRQR
jgi:hypothetical protein